MTDFKLIDVLPSLAPSVFEDVADFHNAGGIEQGLEAIDLRKKLIEEEAKESASALGYVAPDWIKETDNRGDLVAFADGCCDLMYVCAGSLIQLFGVDCAMDLWDEVHRSNMDKFPGGKVIRDENGKIKKPEGWSPPDLKSILLSHGVIS